MDIEQHAPASDTPADCGCPSCDRYPCPAVLARQSALSAGAVAYSTIHQKTAFWFRGHLCLGEIMKDGISQTLNVLSGNPVVIENDDLVIPEPRAKVVFDG